MNSNLAIQLSLSDIVVVIYLLTLATVVIFSTILYYHWEAYAVDAKVKFTTYIIYLAVIIPLILAMTGIILFL
jgi:hypothetical protein